MKLWLPPVGTIYTSHPQPAHAQAEERKNNPKRHLAFFSDRYERVVVAAVAAVALVDAASFVLLLLLSCARASREK